MRMKVIHKGQKNHKCDSCGKYFFKPGVLKAHIMTVHEGQRNYRCDFCGKSSTTKGNLKKHIMAVHEGQRNWNVLLMEIPSPH